MAWSVPSIDDAVRRRLTVRFGHDVDPWLDHVPTVLATLGERWGLEFGTVIPQGSMSIVARCVTADGRAAVLKLAPDRERLALEAAALASWVTPHVPTVYAVDDAAGALLMEAIAPGKTLLDTPGYPSTDNVAELIRSLQRADAPSTASGVFPPLTQLVARLFDSWARPRQLHPELVALVPDDLFERGRRLAARLAAQPSRTVLLHGDLTPVNVLEGGEQRGLVAIDPGPCVGDPAYDAIDLLVWRAADVATIEGRAAMLATGIGVDEARLLDWCAAFAGMFALDLAGPGQRHADDWRAHVEGFLELASRAPTSRPP
jgi:streptomycin 6-kinase